MLTPNRQSQFWSYILTPALVSASTGALMGLCGTIATLAPTPEMAIRGMTVLGLISLVAGGLIGGIALAIRAPAFLALLGAVYSFVIGLFVISGIDNLRRGGEYTSPEPPITSVLSILGVIFVSVLAGSAPSMIWLAYKRAKSFVSRQ